MSNSRTFEDIVEDFIERFRNGENINIDRFAAEYPEHRTELLELLPLVSDMEKLNISWDTDQLPELQDSDFKLLKKIGVGGMGNIYEAEQLSLQRKVAVKVLSPRLFEDEAQKLQFVNEAKLIAQLHHPNIIKIIDAKSSGVYCYYIMELINGTSLDHLHPANITETVKIGIQAAQALDYAHNCGILHRDIKPGNFLLDENGFLHLGDFGLSILQSKKDASFSDTAGGTLRYMAPEQLTDFESSVQSDIYAFGATLYELSFNRPPFSGSSISELKEKICNSTPPIPADTPRGFAAILKKCLHKNPAERYRSAAEVAADLQRFLNHEAVSADKVSPLYRLKLWMKRKPVAAAWAITAMIFLAAAFGTLLIGINQTGKALKQTEFNAHLADQTLEKIFSRLDSLPSSQKNNRLLTELLPYYQQIIRTKKLPEDKLYSAYKIIVKSAIRCGDYPLAETTLRKMLKMYDAPDLKNMLAMVLKRQNRFQEADILHREVIFRCENSDYPEEKIEAVKALLALRRPDKRRAFILLEDLLAENPRNAEYRFQYAVLLGSDPRFFRRRRIPGVEPNPALLLTELAQKHPDVPEYSTELIKLALHKLRTSYRIKMIHQEEIKQTLELSERLICRFPNNPGLTKAVTALHLDYIEYLRDRRQFIPARKCFDRLLSTLEVLFYNPEVSDAVREKLIELQFKRASELNQNPGKAEMMKKIAGGLKIYRGKRREEFQKKYDSLK